MQLHSIGMWELSPRLPTQMPFDKMMAALHVESWETDFVFYSLDACRPVSETSFSPRTTPPRLILLSASSCPDRREETSRRIISTIPSAGATHTQWNPPPGSSSFMLRCQTTLIISSLDNRPSLAFSVFFM
ncbi:unnamed protein product [Pleuronectes platessa]|uniref:Uncharacterized protein n=1 Tax=Pleuronectes platessa TaxID=8262 RepID=A0A9N7UN18_PLEPL|nr:unnamed protein product [Pleuronectes platessa]